MLAKTFTKASDAETFCADVAVAFGMPWVGGTQVGGGVHVDPTKCRTERVVAPEGTKVTLDDAIAVVLDAKPIVDLAGNVIGTEPAKVDLTGFVAKVAPIVGGVE